MPSTLGDFGRDSERYGNIAFFYAFPIKFWFGQHQVAPDDVLSWCRENCEGYYKITCYTHVTSTRNKDGSYDEKIIFVDKIYLSNESDAALIKLTFDVRDQQIKRPARIARKTKKVKKVGKVDNKIAATLKATVTKASQEVQLALF